MSRKTLVEELLVDMQVMQRAWKTHLFKELSEDNISPTQLGVLFYIKHHQPISGKEIAATMQMSPSSVTQFIDALDQRGYICREHDDQDRRIIYISLSKKGHAKIDQLEKKRRDYFAKFTEYLTDDELKTMVVLQQKMAQSLKT
jgi:DNA-binding MarR family transcriptional regulator